MYERIRSDWVMVARSLTIPPAVEEPSPTPESDVVECTELLQALLPPLLLLRGRRFLLLHTWFVMRKSFSASSTSCIARSLMWVITVLRAERGVPLGLCRWDGDSPGALSRAAGGTVVPPPPCEWVPLAGALSQLVYRCAPGRSYQSRAWGGGG